MGIMMSKVYTNTNADTNTNISGYLRVDIDTDVRNVV